MSAITMLPCRSCNGARFEQISTGGRLGDWIAVMCQECRGSGQTPATAVEQADLDRMTAEFEAFCAELDADNADTLAAVERHINVGTVAIAVDHPGMTPAFFDDAVRRAHEAVLSVHIIPFDPVAYITSTNGKTVYRVTRTTCTCSGHRGHGRCLHRAYLIFHTDVLPPALALIAA